jgi:hypothetical protein
MLPEEIGRLAGSYFHQDYDLEYETPRQALEDFRDSEPPEDVRALRDAVRELVASGRSEDELADLWLEEAQASYDPRDDGFEMSGWFRLIQEALA